MLPEGAMLLDIKDKGTLKLNFIGEACRKLFPELSFFKNYNEQDIKFFNSSNENGDTNLI
jgi:hypothetical protein